MSSCSWLILLLLLFAHPLPAAPSQKRAFRVLRVGNPGFRRHDGPTELFMTYRKYRMPIPEDLLNMTKSGTGTGTGTGSGSLDDNGLTGPWRTSANTIGLVPATLTADGVEYVSPIRIGGQTVNVALDSGSADLWVFGAGLPPPAKVGHRTYDPLLSRTFKPMPGANFSIKYGDGTSASGDVGVDVVDVGGAAAINQAVQIATTVSSGFAKDTNVDGLLGLAFSQLSTVKPVKQKTFFENVMPTLLEPLFTADLRKGAPGAYEFGRIDDSRGFWQVPSRKFAVGGSRWTRGPAGQAIVDTGTTLLLLSQHIVDGYYRHVPGAQRTAGVGGVTFPCNTTLPDLHLDVGGVYTATVRGADINFGRFHDDRCFGGIQRTTTQFQVWGDIFFRSQFVVFHGGNHELGMAPHF
ncbi:aspartic peptidase domain-containing protein [Chaetomium sp. MPI-SDFR-AT-0129]|nr:aspartic peptidase domain-containing protein [Chaetomium sp. MPI-SDFR-AT-0129]